MFERYVNQFRGFKAARMKLCASIGDGEVRHFGHGRLHIMPNHAPRLTQCPNFEAHYIIDVRKK